MRLDKNLPQLLNTLGKAMGGTIKTPIQLGSFIAIMNL